MTSLSSFRAIGTALTMIIVSCLFLPGCTRSTRSFYQEGVSRELAKYRARHIYDVHYDLSFTIPQHKEEPVTGVARIHFKPLKARHGLILDFTPGIDHIHSLTINQDSVSYRVMNEHIYVDANGLIPRQENVAEISFTASDQALNRSEDFMYTLFVPDRASTAFPCFDQPDIKATFSLHLNLPPHWTALGNGPVEKEKLIANRKHMHFAADQPISTYLFAFAAGDFQVVSHTKNQRTLNLYHRETDSRKLAHNLPSVFEQHFKALNWLEEYTGIAYPYKKFDMALLPGFQYSGMEHPGAVWYRDERLLLDENAPLSRKISKATLIAHETAHMWFGNLVTMQWFDDVWLKEVFAGFIADKIIEAQFPEENHKLQFVLSHYPRAYNIDRSQGTHPIKQPLDNLKMAGTLYGRIIYNKAPIVFEQLEKIMQPPAFRAAVQEYLHTFAHGNADWDDLVRIFDKHSHEDITRWSNAWVYGEGMPIISYHWQPANDAKQQAYLTATCESSQPHSPFPAQYLKASLVTGRHEIVNKTIWLHESPIHIPTEETPDHIHLVLLNGQGTGYGFFVMQDSDLDFALYKGWKLKDDNLRASLYINLHENFLNARVAAERYFDFLLQSLQAESNDLLQNYLLQNLKIVCINFLDYETDEQYSQQVEDLLWNRLNDQESGVRQLYFEKWITLARSAQSARQMYELYTGKISLPGFPISDPHMSLLALEASLRSPQYRQLPEKEQKRIQNPDRLRRFQFLLPAVSPDKEVRDAFFAHLKEAQNRRPEPWVIEGLYFLHHPLHPNQGIDYVKESLYMLEEIQQTGDIFFPQNWLQATLHNYRDPLVAQMVREYLLEEIPHNLRLKVYQASDLIMRSEAMQQNLNGQVSH